MTTLFFCLLLFYCPAQAASSRTVRLSDGDMAEVYVEPGYSTLLKFDSHPEPGLIGDQDGFKVEYLKSIVAIKPLMTHGQTNLFVFTKDGQFGFKLISAHGRHDNLIYVRPKPDGGPAGPTVKKTIIAIDDLLTRKIEKTVRTGDVSLTLKSVATPTSRSTIVLKVTIRQKFAVNTKATPWDEKVFSISQGSKSVKIENAFFEKHEASNGFAETDALLLMRAADFKHGESAKLVFLPPAKAAIQLAIPFSTDFH